MQALGKDPECDDPGGIEGVTKEFHGPIGKGSEGCPRQMRNAVTIAAALNISSVIAHL